MAEKHVLIEHSSTINHIIRNTFHTTQRIRFTAFDVSQKYITFGVNSGGIYIFTRDPCQFLKLIPSTHGPANILSISPNEKNLAIAVSIGLVIVLEDFTGVNFQQQVFSEHEGDIVTAIKWNGNDLYCGDNKGRVSVVTLRNFLTMFQTPVACLMHLDSQIVQLDTYSKFLLVSTQTRSLLCDTETEKYRQIGKKMRDGNFGACFLTSGKPPQPGDNDSRVRNLFQTLSDNEQLSPINDNNVKIYCARPGVRLWQADFQGNVVLTHQFRSSLRQKPSNIFTLSDKLQIKSFEGSINEGFNFGKVYSFLNKYILTFGDNGFYIFEPCSSALTYWSPHLNHIKDVKIVDSFLYIWCNDLEIEVLSLLTIEELILRSLMRKQYHLCAQICLQFFDELESLIETSKKIHLVLGLESKLDDSNLLLKLVPIFTRLKEWKPPREKINNGIVTVNTLPPVLPESVDNYDCKKKDPNSILLEQFKINKIHKNVFTTDFDELLKSQEPDSIYDIFVKFQDTTSDCDLWCGEMLLKYLDLSQGFKEEALDYAIRSFFQINDHNKSLTCECDFPLPQAHKTRPKYYEIGNQLMEKTPNFTKFLKNVPYLNGKVLEKISDSKDLQLNLPLLIQFSDSKIIEMHLNKITYDLWDDSVRLLLKLKSNQCLNCGSKISPEATIDWTVFGTLMIDSIKPKNALKLLKRYANELPKGQLEGFFYQYCIFSSVSDTKMSYILKNDAVKKQFETSVGGYLRKKYLCGSDYYDPPNNKLVELSNCDHCQMPLRIPIIESCKLTCGHSYHQVCLSYGGSRCPICDPVLLNKI